MRHFQPFLDEKLHLMFTSLGQARRNTGRKPSEELGVNVNCFKDDRRGQSSKELASDSQTKISKSTRLFICFISSHSKYYGGGRGRS